MSTVSDLSILNCFIDVTALHFILLDFLFKSTRCHIYSLKLQFDDGGFPYVVNQDLPEIPTYIFSLVFLHFLLNSFMDVIFVHFYSCNRIFVIIKIFDVKIWFILTSKFTYSLHGNFKLIVDILL